MKAKTVGEILGVLVTLPIWYYLLYHILVRVNASELMMFLFWVYFPVGVIAQLLIKIGTDEK